MLQCVTRYRPPGGIIIPQRRPAVRAAVRLGVVAPVLDVVILAVTVRAHRKGFHRGLRPVIGDILDNGETRSAIGAVDEGKAVAPVCRVSHLAQAVRTDADIRRDQRVPLGLALALDDPEIRKALKGNPVCPDLFNDGERRGLFRQLAQEGAESVFVPLQSQGHAGGGVADAALQGMRTHQAVDKRPKAHPLDDAANSDLPRLHPRRLRMNRIAAL